MATTLLAFPSLLSTRHGCSRRLPLRLPPFAAPRLRVGPLFCSLSGYRRLSPLLTVKASNEEPPSDIIIDDDKAKMSELNGQEEWERSLKRFKAKALEVKAMSAEVYTVYSKKAMEILLETSEKLKIQADQAQKDLSVIMNEISEEGKVYIDRAAENSPESVKDVAETFRSIPELKNLGNFEDYHIGIPYGTYLFVGGFLDFMLTGSIAAIRFGIVLGFALLALSISSLRSTRNGRRSPLLLKGQTVIASILLLRQLSVLFQKGLSAVFPAFISGAVAVFYVYYMLTRSQQKGPDMGLSPEN